MLIWLPPLNSSKRQNYNDLERNVIHKKNSNKVGMGKESLPLIKSIFLKGIILSPTDQTNQHHK